MAESDELVRDWDALPIVLERLSAAETKLAAVAKFADTLDGYSDSWPSSSGKLVASQLRELL